MSVSTENRRMSEIQQIYTSFKPLLEDAKRREQWMLYESRLEAMRREMWMFGGKKATTRFLQEHGFEEATA